MRKGRLDRCAEARVVVDLVAVLAVWWEHLPIEVVLQMLGGRCRNRGGVFGVEALQIRGSGPACERDGRSVTVPTSLLQSAHLPIGRVGIGPTFLPSDSCGPKRISQMFSD